MQEFKTKLSADLKPAIKRRDLVAVKTIRSLMSAIDNAGAISVTAPKIMPMAGGIAGATGGLGSTEAIRKTLTDEDIRQIIKSEIDEIAGAIVSINDDSRPEVAELKEQIGLLEKYLSLII